MGIMFIRKVVFVLFLPGIVPINWFQMWNWSLWIDYDNLIFVIFYVIAEKQRFVTLVKAGSQNICCC